MEGIIGLILGVLVIVGILRTEAASLETRERVKRIEAKLGIDPELPKKSKKGNK